MADAKATEEQVTTEVVKEAATGDTGLTAAQEELAKVKAELDKNAELLKKVRKFEKENKEAAEKALKEQGEFKKLYEEESNKRSQLEEKIKSKAVEGAVTKALEEAKAKSISTVMKLIDKTQIGFTDDYEVDTKTVEAVIKELQKTDPILFDAVGEQTSNNTKVVEKKVAPNVRRANEGDVLGGYQKELKAAKSQKAVEAVMRKHGII